MTQRRNGMDVQGNSETIQDREVRKTEETFGNLV
jgi:hypothetical protein